MLLKRLCLSYHLLHILLNPTGGEMRYSMPSIRIIRERGHRKYLCKIRNKGFRELWFKRGWTGKGAWCEKGVAGKTALMQIVEKHPDYLLCSFVFKENVWEAINNGSYRKL